MINNLTLAVFRRKKGVSVVLPEGTSSCKKKYISLNDPSRIVIILVSLFFSTITFAINTKTATTTGNWSNSSIWSPAGVPKDTDNIIINSGVTVTVDGDYTCRNLSVGSATNSSATLKIITAGNSLTATGDLDLNPSNKSSTFTIDAGPGDMSFNGTFSHWGTSGTNQFKIGSGAMSFAPAVSITDNSQYLIFTGTGTVNFQSNFSDANNRVTFLTGCTINFYGDYAISGTNVTWGGMGTANFYGSGKTITATKNIIMNTVNIASGASTTLSSLGAGTFQITGNLTLSGGDFTANKSYQLDGSLTNNGGMYTSGAGTTTSFTGSAASISGSSACPFATLQIGKSTSEAADVVVTLGKTTSATNLVFTSTNKSHTFKLNSSSVALTVTGNVTLNQPTLDNKSNTMNVQAGTLNINGNLTFSGSSNSDTRVCQITTGSGTFNIDGTLTWMSNSKVKTEVISVNTGTVNFGSSITMGSGSGTIKAITSGDINFNGTSAPSLSFGGSTAPTLTFPYGSTATFAKGLTATTTALTFSAGSNQIFKGTGTITPTAAITFGNFQINSGYTVTLAGNISVVGNFTNNGGTFTPSTYTVTMSGNGTQTVSSISGTNTFYKLTLSVNGTILLMDNDVTVTNTLTMNGHKINANGHTLTLGNGSGAALSYTMGRLYGGTFKRYWPLSAITSTSGNYYGYFPVGTSSKTRQVEINSTSSPTVAGYVSAVCTDVSGSTNLSYTDNEGSNIQAIANQHNDISISGGLTGGTYTIGVKFTDMGGGGSLSNYKLETYTGSVMGSTGTHATTTGSSSAPLGKRTGVSLANLSNSWVIGTNDRTSSPLYTYLYSRKTGNWNDNNATTGTWSYTAGGSACGCTPSSAAYATIQNGHTVTLTASDSIQYLDINNGGALTINSSKTLNVVADMAMYGTGTFTNNGTLKVENELTLSSATSPTVNSNVTVMGYFTLPTGTAYTQSAGTLTVSGDIDISGALSLASGASLVLDGNNANITGTGTFTSASTGNFPITNSHNFDEDANITFGTSGTNTKITIAANTTVYNCGTITINGKLLAANASTSAWIQQGGSVLSVTDSLLPTGIFDPSTSPNTVYYNGTGAQTCISSTTAYYNLSATNGGTKTLVGDLIITNALTLGGSTILDEGSYIISGNASLNMSGTAELKMTRSVEETYPELTGNYNCTGGTVTITQTADSCQIQEGAYYNLKLNGSAPYNLSAVSSISNNLDVTNTASINGNTVLTVGGMFTHSSTSNLSYLSDSIAVGGINLSAGTVSCVDNSINVKGSGGWTKASGATFTSGTGTVYFTGSSNQTIGGTSTSQSFYSLCVDKNSNSVAVGGSTTTLNIGGDLTLNAGVLDNGTATAINITAGNWNNNGGVFTPGSGTVTFNSTGTDQAIQGTNTAETFNHVTVTKSSTTLAIGGSLASVTLNGNMTLSSGTLDAGITPRGIVMAGGNWTNNGGTFNAQNSVVSFTGTGAQAINGTVASQTFNKITVNKSSGTLSVGGSTTALTLNSDLTLSAGTFDKGTATTISAYGDWINNGGTFTPGLGTVECVSGVDQAIKGSATAQSFYNLTINKSGGNLNMSGSTTSLTVNNTLTFTNGKLTTGPGTVIIPASATVTGANSSRYIYGNEEMYIPNTAAPSKTFDIGDSSVYAPVTLAFSGTVSGSGSIGVHCQSGDDAAISTSGIDGTKSVNRTWDITNNGVTGFTSYAPTFNFAAGDVDGSANTANFEVRRLTGGTWYSTTAGTRTSTSTQATGETFDGRFQIGEKTTLSVTTQPSDTSRCSGQSASFTSVSTSTPTPTVKWQRDPNTGTFADITGSMDGSVYTNFTTTTLNVSNTTGLNNYKYRAVFTNINGSVNSNQATLSETAPPSITGTTPGSRCDAGTVGLTATSSAGTINWYAASSGGSSLGSGTSFTTPSISSTTSYYVDATANGCTTSSRTGVVATVTATPTITGISTGSHCSTGTVDLGATASAGTINWYAASTGGVSLGTGNTFTTPSISSTTTYYVDATTGGCTTTSRTGVLATINPLPTATVTYQSCAGVDGNTTIRLTPSGGTGPYTYKINGGAFVSSDTFHVANGSTQDYYTSDAFGCSSNTTTYAATSTSPSQIASAIGSTTCNCPSSAEGRDVYLTDQYGNLIAIVNDKGHDLGTITATTYVRSNPVVLNNNQGGTSAALGRSFVLDFNGTNLSPAVEVKFPFTNAEYNDLVTAAAATPTLTDDISSITDIGDTQYEGPDEDSTYSTASATMLVYHRQLTNGTILGGKYVKIGLTSNGEHWMGGSGGGSPLPVTLVHFTATTNETLETVETEWQTSLEINNHYFAVERSSDGINFTEVGRVAGAGNYTGSVNYHFTDVKPVHGLSYYRLRQVDFDGDFTYSNIVSVTLGNQSSFTLFPNPSSSEININVANPSDEIKLTIYDISGIEVFSRTYAGNVQSKNQMITLHAKELFATGMYMVKVFTNGTEFKQKLALN